MILIPLQSTAPSKTLLAFKGQWHESEHIFTRNMFQETSKELFH